METIERKQPRRRRSFTPEFKAEIVERCRAGDRSVGQVARDFDLTETAVRAWVTQAETDARDRGAWPSRQDPRSWRSVDLGVSRSTDLVAVPPTRATFLLAHLAHSSQGRRGTDQMPRDLGDAEMTGTEAIRAVAH
jgi:transposase